MTSLSPRKKNVYLEKIDESLSSLFRTAEKFQQTNNGLSQLANGATVHINDMERILGQSNDDDDDDDDQNKETETEEQQWAFNENRESMAGEKLCELNENLNTSLREIRQSWSVFDPYYCARNLIV